APSNGHAIESMQSVAQGSYGIGHAVPNSIYSPGTAAEPALTGPRWIAESVAVAQEESTLVLEHEMEQAHAASTAIEAVNNNFSGGTEPASSTLSIAGSVASEVSSQSGTAAVESVPTSISADAGAVGLPPIGDSESAPAKEEAAYAAAASVGSVADYRTPVEPVSPTDTPPEPSQNKSTGQPDVGSRRETELA